jgi:archaellum component FlaF (FlaF/FlaG flagellin family)
MKFVLAAILTVATLMGVGALVSAVNRADHGAAHANNVWHQHQDLTQRAA